MNGHDFVAVKIGDVNGNATTSNAQDEDIEARTANSLGFVIDEKSVEKSEIVTIPVRATQDAEVYGYQTTMIMDGAEYVSIEAGALDITSTNIAIHGKGRMTMSYAGIEMKTVKAGEVLFTLTIKATKAKTTETMFALSNEITRSESYLGNDMEVGKLILNTRTKTAEDAIILMQNEPNPWKAETKISYYMPNAGKVRLTIYDVTGKEVSTREIEAVKGQNQERYTKGQIGASSGVYYYKLESGAYTATKKMILVE